MRALIRSGVIVITLLFGYDLFSQVAISSDGSAPDNSSMLDVKSTSKGFLVPRMTSTQMSSISAPVAGLLIYNTTSQAFYNFNGTSWMKLDAGSAGILKDADGNTKVEVEKNPNEDIIRFSLGGTEKMTLKSNRLEFTDPGGNTFVGYYAGSNNSSGQSNTSLGYFCLSGNTSGQNNVGIGYYALLANNTSSNNTSVGSYSMAFNSGSNNTAFGYSAMYTNSSGHSNTAVGTHALYSNTTRSNLVAVGDSSLYYNGTGASNSTHATGNSALGSKSLYSNTIGSNNTASGTRALYSNTTGSTNVAYGSYALYSNTVGLSNVAIGAYAQYYNVNRNHIIAIGDSALMNNGLGVTQGSNLAIENTAVGSKALLANNYGKYNSAFGYHSLWANTTGGFNTAIGHSALYYNTTGGSNTAVGQYALGGTNGDWNVGVGLSAGDGHNVSFGTFIGGSAGAWEAGYTNCTAIGYDALVNASNKVVIGNTSVTSIGGYAGWTNFSDQRYKTEIEENVKGLDFIMKLRPVTYRLDEIKLATDMKEDLEWDMEKQEFVITTNAMDIEARLAKSRIVYTGFLAQEVEAAAQSVGFDFSGVDAPQTSEGFYGLRYAEFVVPLVKAVQEQQVMIDEQKMMIQEQKQLIDSQQTQIEELYKRLDLLVTRINQ